MHIAFVSVDATLPLRSSQLRDGKELERCRFDSDYNVETFHLAQINQDGTIVCVLSCHPNNTSPVEGKGFQLRGMVTDPDFQRKGLGKALVKYCVNYLKSLDADYLWCNARQIAYSFYSNMGFKYLTEEFEIENVGLHRKMLLQLK